MDSYLNVVICTHNPQHKYFDKVLSALKSQTLSLEQWNLLIIDNASDKLISEEIDIAWHPRAAIVREERLGLVHARLRAIQETKGEILVFVDDDNVLADDYLEVVLQISKNWLILGAWGGQCIGQFEEKPPSWTEPYWGLLTIREFDNDRWTNLTGVWDATPAGAGMCVRRCVAESYSELLCSEPKRLSLGRKGSLLHSSEDIDLAYTACDLGLGIGLFASLKLHHLIAPYRLEESYLMRLVEGLSYSKTILDSMREKNYRITWLHKLKILMPWLISLKVLMMKPTNRRVFLARRRGFLLALQDLNKTIS